MYEWEKKILISIEEFSVTIHKIPRINVFYFECQDMALDASEMNDRIVVSDYKNCMGVK
jgi:hypothetical protein